MYRGCRASSPQSRGGSAGTPGSVCDAKSRKPITNSQLHSCARAMAPDFSVKGYESIAGCYRRLRVERDCPKSHQRVDGSNPSGLTNTIKELRQKFGCCHDSFSSHGNAGGNILQISLPRVFHGNRHSRFHIRAGQAGVTPQG